MHAQFQQSQKLSSMANFCVALIYSSSSPCWYAWQQRWYTTEFFSFTCSCPCQMACSKSLSYLVCRCHGSKKSWGSVFIIQLVFLIVCVARTYTSPVPPGLRIRPSSARACTLRSRVAMWCSRAMQISESQHSDLIGSEKMSAAITSLFGCFYLEIFNSGMHRSTPMVQMALLTEMFRPLPEPTSSTKLPLLMCWMKRATLGQGLYLVYEKCSAILSQVLCTQSSSICGPLDQQNRQNRYQLDEPVNLLSLDREAIIGSRLVSHYNTPQYSGAKINVLLQMHPHRIDQIILSVVQKFFIVFMMPTIYLKI